MIPTLTTISYDNPAPAIARITLQRPAQLNAYTPRMCAELVTALETYWNDDSSRVLIVTGAGRAFCSGGDVGAGRSEFEEVLDSQLGRARELRVDMHRVNRMLYDLDKPTVAMVNGPAISGGLTLALLCDYRIAGESARVGDPSGRVGLLPDEGGAWLFPRFMRPDRAMRMVLAAEIYDAREGLDLGLLSEVVPDEELEDRVLEFARALAGASPIAARIAHRLMRRALTLSFEEALGDAQLAVLVNNVSEDAQEGRLAFHEKRAPHFRGR